MDDKYFGALKFSLFLNEYAFDKKTNKKTKTNSWMARNLGHNDAHVTFR